MTTTTTKERVETPITGEIHDAPNQAHALTRPGAPAPGGEQQHEEPQQMRFSREQVELMKRTIAKDATDDELTLFVQVCERRRLDPFAKQIYFVKRKGRVTFQTGIDGFRLIAERTGKYAGQLPFEWAHLEFVNGKPVLTWYDVWPYDDEYPHAARAHILRTDFKAPITAVARFNAYAQYTGDGELVQMWENMDAEQLAKCAEALGLRKAFPEELSGIYTTDEMAQAENPDDIRRAPPPQRPAEERRQAPEKVETLAHAIEHKLPWKKHAKYGTPLVQLASEHLHRALDWCERIEKEAQVKKEEVGPVVTNLRRAAELILSARGTGELEEPPDEVEDPRQAKLFDPVTGKEDTGPEPDPTRTRAASSAPTTGSAPASDASSSESTAAASSPTTKTPGESATTGGAGESLPDPADRERIEHPLKFRANATPEGRLALETLENTDLDELSIYDACRVVKDAIVKGPFDERERASLTSLFASAGNSKAKLRTVKKSVIATAAVLPF